MRILVTGCAGFIGFYTAKALLDRGDEVVGIDNLNDYYDVRLKQARLDQLTGRNGFKFEKCDIVEQNAMNAIFQDTKFDTVIHLAAQAGVRYSIDNPRAYVDANILGFMNILEGCRHSDVQHLVFASSSSVYGANTNLPFSVEDNVDHPVSFYAATKKSNELMAHTYAHLYNLPVTGLRFFTVYGPWGRPDMALFKFTKNILANEPIDVYNMGEHARDFTFISDIVEGIIRTADQTATSNPEWSGDDPDPSSSKAPYRLYNIGNNNPVELMHFIECIEKALGKTAEKNFLPLQSGDVPRTYADIEALEQTVGFKPATTIEEGIKQFVAWYREYYT